MPNMTKLKDTGSMHETTDGVVQEENMTTQKAKKSRTDSEIYLVLHRVPKTQMNMDMGLVAPAFSLKKKERVRV